MAGVILSTIMFNAAYAHTISGSEEPADGDHAAAQLWDFLSGGLLTPPARLSRGISGPQRGRDRGEELARPFR